MRTAPYHVDTKGLVYTFSRHHPPRLRVPDGSRLEIETCDCFENQLQRPEDTLTALDWNRVNPATGPLFVEGAEPGDVLAVTIEAITVNDQGVLVAGHEFGVLASKFDALHSRLVPVRRGRVVFDDRLSLPVRPMIGVIGVAPAGDPTGATWTPPSSPRGPRCTSPWQCRGPFSPWETSTPPWETEKSAAPAWKSRGR